MLCRETWRATFISGLTSDSHRYELQNFLKCDGQTHHHAFLYIIFKNSHLSVCAYFRISPGTKVVQLEELHASMENSNFNLNYACKRSTSI